MKRMPKISVLMSIYNETERMIEESVESILNQTFKNFEFIIVCDNPLRRKEIDDILRRFNDERIKLVFNERNIGLALSMNKAAEIASTEIFARMDADDIAEPDRFSAQIKIMNQGYDFVFCNYTCIDEDGNTIPFQQVVYKADVLNKIVSTNPGIVHHPTTMFTRELFYKACEYRNFPCAQDNDLWLRMQENGAKFYMIAEPMLKYRVTSRSITGSKWFKQQLTTHYIIKLSIERLKHGSDSYSLNNYEKYLTAHGVNNKSIEAKLHQAEHILTSAMQYRIEGKIFKSFLSKLYVFTTCPILRNYYIMIIHKKIIQKY